MHQRPFCSPHHTITPQGLVGGGIVPKPGEISLAHKGVLFLDELAEFQKSTLELLRQPMEEKQIHIARLQCGCSYPADFMLVAATNIATPKLIQWKTAEMRGNKPFRGFGGFIFLLFETFFCCGGCFVLKICTSF